MRITAKERGRNLEITVGGPDDDMTEEEAAEASAAAVRIIVPPVNAQAGAEIWAHYARILFASTDESEEDTAVRMTKLALGAYVDEDATEQQRALAAERWDAIEALRWSESEQVCQLALYWNAQGGGQDVVDAMLQDGHPKAQELLLTRNQLWNVYSRLRMLMRSQNSDAANAILGQVDSSDTNIPSGTSSPVAVDAFGIKQTA